MRGHKESGCKLGNNKTAYVKQVKWGRTQLGLNDEVCGVCNQKVMYVTQTHHAIMTFGFPWKSSGPIHISKLNKIQQADFTESFSDKIIETKNS